MLSNELILSLLKLLKVWWRNSFGFNYIRANCKWNKANQKDTESSNV